jgi:glyceraldehyde 3-phosphate dehydrogenase
MKKTRVAINGLGRIGRAFFRLALERSEELEIVAVNDLGDIKNLTHLLRYDTVYGRLKTEISEDGENISAGGRTIAFLQEANPRDLPWKKLAIDVVVESTGAFASYEKARAHLDAGARRIVISAPVKDEPARDFTGATVLMGVNESELAGCAISSNASCTTNAVSPIMEIMKETLGVEKAILNTIHSYTASQSLVDSPNAKDFRRGRAAAANIIPSSTGAAHAVAKAIPELDGLFDGIALRVPVLAGSIADITFVSKKKTIAEEVNKILVRAAREERWRGIFTTTDEPIVSSDIVGQPYASIADLTYTRVVGGDLVKILAWYDNEMGYTYTLVDHVIKAGRLL